MFNRLALFALMFTSVGCGYSLGITPGGSQDIGYARDLIASGQVPPADSITVGGLLNEHDLPLETEDCAQLLCITGTAGVGRVDVEGTDSVFLQIGYDSDLESDEFNRQAQTIVAVVDISGSMGDAVTEIRHSLEQLVDSLNQNDTLAVVTYGNKAKTLLR